MLRITKFTAAICLVVFLFPAATWALDIFQPAAPYTEQAFYKLLKATQRTQAPTSCADANKKEIRTGECTKQLYNYCKTWYKNAGYSCGKSIIETADIIVSNRVTDALRDSRTSYLTTVITLNQFYTVHKLGLLNKDYLPKDVYAALIKFVNFESQKEKELAEQKAKAEAIAEAERKASEKARQEGIKQEKIIEEAKEQDRKIKQKEKEAAEKEERLRILNRVSGHYRNTIGNAAVELDMSVIDENTVTLDIVNQAGCRIQEVAAKIEYDSSSRIHAIVLEDLQCRLSLRRLNEDNYLLMQKGMCSLCPNSRPNELNGSFRRTEKR